MADMDGLTSGQRGALREGFHWVQTAVMDEMVKSLRDEPTGLHFMFGALAKLTEGLLANVPDGDEEAWGEMTLVRVIAVARRNMMLH